MNNDAYAAALAEIEEGRLDKGVWARSFADSGGDESKAKALYIKARAESIQSAAVWQDTRPPAADDAGVEATNARVDSGGNVAQGIDGATNSPNSGPASSYESAIGERSRDYYLSKFEGFDEQGPGLHASWNWAAFFFTGYWALYRKMYVWFFAWWAVGTVGTILLKVPNSQFQRWVGLGYVACSLGFGAYANSLFHLKIKARIAAAQKPNSDAARVSKRLSAVGGVHMWVPIGLGGLTLLGIVAAVALPAYEDYTKRQTVAASAVPAKSFSYEEAVGQAKQQPDFTYTTPAFGANDKIVGGPYEDEKKSWSGNPFDKFDTVDEIAVRARQFSQLNETRAWAAVLAWQESNMRVDKNPANEALHYAVGTVLAGLKDNKGVCQPGRVEIVSAAQASKSMPAGTPITLLNCDR